jgi:hypothetical protein
MVGSYQLHSTKECHEMRDQSASVFLQYLYILVSVVASRILVIVFVVLYCVGKLKD